MPHFQRRLTVSLSRNGTSLRVAWVSWSLLNPRSQATKAIQVPQSGLTRNLSGLSGLRLWTEPIRSPPFRFLSWEIYQNRSQEHKVFLVRMPQSRDSHITWTLRSPRRIFPRQDMGIYKSSNNHAKPALSCPHWYRLIMIKSISNASQICTALSSWALTRYSRSWLALGMWDATPILHSKAQQSWHQTVTTFMVSTSHRRRESRYCNVALNDLERAINKPALKSIYKRRFVTLSVVLTQTKVVFPEGNRRRKMMGKFVKDRVSTLWNVIDDNGISRPRGWQWLGTPGCHSLQTIRDPW